MVEVCTAVDAAAAASAHAAAAADAADSAKKQSQLETSVIVRAMLKPDFEEGGKNAPVK